MQKMIKIGITLGMLCGLLACQEVKNETSNLTDQAQDKLQQTVVASSVVDPANAVSKNSILTDLQATSSTAIHIPQVVEDYVAQLQSNCKMQDKIALKDAVRLIDVWGDERPEYLIEADNLICYEYASDRGNSAGRDLTLFATLASGETKQILNHVIYDYRIEEAKPKPQIYLAVGGGYCRQNMQEISRSEAIYCERLLEWDEKSQQFILGKMMISAPASSPE